MVHFYLGPAIRVSAASVVRRSTAAYTPSPRPKSEVARFEVCMPASRAVLGTQVPSAGVQGARLHGLLVKFLEALDVPFGSVPVAAVVGPE